MASGKKPRNRAPKKQRQAAKLKAAKPGNPRAQKPAVAGPREDQKFVKKLTDMAKTNNVIIDNYVAHVIDPANTNPVRIPDATIGSEPSAIVSSEMSFDLDVDTTSTVNQPGRFGFVIQPSIGDASRPDRFKIAVVETTTGTGWPANLALNSSYRRNVGGTTLTVDKAAKTLIEPAPFYFEAEAVISAGLLATDPPLGEGGAPDGPNVSADTWTIQPATSDNINSKFGAAPLFTFPQAAGVTSNIITLPPGQYTLDLLTSFAGANGGASAHLLTPANPANCEISRQLIVAPAAATESDTTWIVSVYDKAEPITISWDTTGAFIQPTVAWTTDVKLTTSWARPDGLVTPALNGYPLNGGMTREYVPVAMSVLVTCIAAKLTNGGDIACALISPNSCDVNVFTTMPQPDVGNLLDIENLRNLRPVYDGEMKNGCYAIWKPWGSDDMVMRSPQSQRNHHWPCIVVAGNALESGVPGIKKILRVKVFTTYQLVTNVTLLPLAYGLGDTATREAALQIIRMFQGLSANGTHFDNIKAFFAKLWGYGQQGVKFYLDNKEVIDNAGKLAMSFV